MAGIFPDISVGGIIIRDGAGTPTGAPGVTNGYIPAVTFTMSCAEALYGDDCAATRWRPELYNAMASELLAFAEALNPGGTWSCSSLTNLAVNFEAWRDGTGPGSLAEALGSVPPTFMSMPVAP